MSSKYATIRQALTLDDLANATARLAMVAIARFEPAPPRIITPRERLEGEAEDRARRGFVLAGGLGMRRAERF